MLLFCWGLTTSLTVAFLLARLRLLLDQRLLGAHRNLHIELTLGVCAGIYLLTGDTGDAGIGREA